MNRDVFVSHAFEDKEFAHALADGLSKKGLRVWFDGFELKVGDSLRRSIDYGLSKSKFGVVILSPSFFAKEWTQKELDALTARETKNKKIILPIWHNISVKDIRRYSPTLADRLAINSIIGIEKTVDSLITVIKPKVPRVPKITTSDLELVSDRLRNIKKSLAVKEIEIKAVLAVADELAHTDDLTSLPNRRRIVGDLQRQVKLSEQHGTPLSVAIVDIDNFKKINDVHGHIIGDEVLMGFASILREPIYFPNTIGRLGGTEFLLVMPFTTLSDATGLAKRLRERIQSTPIVYQEQTFHLMISTGIAQFKIHKEDWRELLNRADKELYRAKKQRI